VKFRESNSKREKESRQYPVATQVQERPRGRSREFQRTDNERQKENVQCAVRLHPGKI